jgi:peptidoglycan/LPS O-acetylase OafA/YrhL
MDVATGRQGKIEFANSLRGLAALSVLISHYLGVFWVARTVAGDLANTTVLPESVMPTPLLARAFLSVPVSWGPLGVALFFLISGFVIPFAFDRRSAIGFLIGRVFRIYPLYFAGFSVTLLAVAVSGALSGRAFPYDIAHVAIHYIPGLRDLLWKPPIDWIVWTLEIELKFYLVCACVAVWLRRGSMKVFVVPLLLLGVVWLWRDQPWGDVRRSLAYSAEYMIFMFAGIAFNYWFRSRLDTPLLALLSAYVLALVFAAMRIAGEPVMTIVSYGVAFVIFSIAAARSARWRSTPVLSFLADISYPLYVVHGVMGYAVMAHLTAAGVSAYLAIAIAVVLAIAVAWGLHRAVEMPTHRMGQRFARRF